MPDTQQFPANGCLLIFQCWFLTHHIQQWYFDTNYYEFLICNVFLGVLNRALEVVKIWLWYYLFVTYNLLLIRNVIVWEYCTCILSCWSFLLWCIIIYAIQWRSNRYHMYALGDWRVQSVSILYGGPFLSLTLYATLFLVFGWLNCFFNKIYQVFNVRYFISLTAVFAQLLQDQWCQAVVHFLK